MKGLLARIYCRRDDGTDWFPEVALGEDGNLYPVDPELVDSMEGYYAAVELGFDEHALQRDDMCVATFFMMNRQCSMLWHAAPLPVLGRIAVEWLLRYPFMFDVFKNASEPCNQVPDTWWLAEKTFEDPDVFPETPIASAMLVFDQCKRRKKFMKLLSKSEHALFKAAQSLVEMAFFFKRGDENAARRCAGKVARRMRVALGKRSEYWGMSESTVHKALEEDQLRRALAVIDKFDAWNVELDA